MSETMSDVLKLGLLGLGTVGQGVVRVLARNAEEIERRAGRPVRVVHASARDLSKARDCNLDGIRLSADAADVVADPDVDVVVELIGGTTLARELVLKAVAAGKPVVTANKALIAEYGNELFEQARPQGTVIAYEAAVAGGIPIIKAVREGLAGNRVQELAGIINGTCNYILTQMRAHGVAFDSVLEEAQKLGYAEADPSFDVDGVDAAHKLTILASIAFGMPLAFDQVMIEGIREVSPQDISLAGEFGYIIKHLGIAKRVSEGVELRVHPTLVPQEHLLARVDGVLNSVVVQGDAVGRTGYYGAGAGAEATASAVLADVIDVARSGPQAAVPPLAFQPEAITELKVLGREAIESAYYLRLTVADEPGVLKAITSILAERDISIEAILQKEPKHGADATVALLTSVTQEARFDAAVADMQALPFIRSALSRLRVEHIE